MESCSCLQNMGRLQLARAILGSQRRSPQLSLYRFCSSAVTKGLERSSSSSAEESPLASASEHAGGNVAEANVKSRTWDKHRLAADQLQFRSLASDFAENELLPFAAQWDEQKHFLVDVLWKAAKLQFGGVFCGHDVGGLQLSRADGAVIFEALAYADVFQKQQVPF